MQVVRAAGYVGAEGQFYGIPKGWASGGGRLIVIARGAGGDHTSNMQDVRDYAELGFAVISADLGYTSTATWNAGNDTALSRVDSAWTFMQSEVGVRSDKLIFAGGSGGAILALNYAKSNPSKVAAISLGIPAVSLTDLHDNDRGSTAAPIEAAYGGLAGYQAAVAAKDPYLNIASIPSIPIRFFISEDDPTAVASYAYAFARQHPTTMEKSIGARLHTSAVTADEHAAFFRPYA